MKPRAELCCLGIASAAVCLAFTPASALEVGDPIPDVEFLDAEGGTHRLHDFTGKWIFLDIWSSRCGPCVEEIPNIQQAFTDHPSDNYQAIGVSIDPSLQEWKSTMKLLGVTYPQFHSKGNFTSAIAEAFDVTFIPSTWLIDPSGTIAGKQIGGEGVPRLFSLLAEGDEKAIANFQSESAAWTRVIEAYSNEGLEGSDPGAVVNALTAYLGGYAGGSYAEMAEEILLSKGLDASGNPMARAETGALAPGFTYVNQDGEEHSLEEFRKSWVVIVTWESWDVPFIDEHLPVLEALQETYAAQGGAILLLNMDASFEDWKSALKEHKAKATHAHPAGRTTGRFRYQYGAEAPTTYLIDPDGVYLTRDFGAENVKRYLEALTQGTDEDRKALFDAFVDPEEVKLAYNKVIEVFGQVQMEQVPESAFTQVAKEFMEKYPHSNEARMLGEIVE